MPSKSKEIAIKEPIFRPTQVVGILLQKWFLLEPRLPKFNFENEDNDLEFFDLYLEMKSSSLKVLAQGAPIDLDSMPKVQRGGTQRPLEVQFSFVSKPSDIGIKK
jgi:hypothetical protein